jgi:steroid delta-isomerase-like uncharacterized protein
VNVIAEDWRRLAAFYTDVFGCVLVPPERDYEGADLARGTAVVEAALQGAHLRLPGHGDTGPSIEIYTYRRNEKRLPNVANRLGFAHIAFAVDGVEAAREAVLAAGGGTVGEVVSLSTSDGRHVTWCYVSDPEGKHGRTEGLELNHVSVEDNKAIVRRFVDEIFVRGNASAVDELVAENFVPHTWPHSGDGRADLKASIERVHAGLADIEFTIEDLLADDDRVAVRLTSGARHVGDFMGMPASGRSYRIGEIHLFRLRDGQVVEHWHQMDTMGLMQQLRGNGPG